jgi:hypothetical protein
MEKKEYKKYFRLVSTDDDYYFQSNTWDIMRFAGGWDGRKKFIIQSLINLYWETEAANVWGKFLNALDNIHTLTDKWKNTGIFVLYQKNHAPQIQRSEPNQKVYGSKQEHTESWKGIEKKDPTK